tara:strand:+ start:1010 stop:1486 length:477 start_codon:yes stop_codon:yes gene_type:complete
VNKILPKEIKNIYQGHPIAFWGFIAFLALMTWRSIVHLAYQEYGLHQIANFNLISGDPDPMPVIYLFFSLWGLAQLIFCLFCWVVVFRYKELISLMYILFISEWAIRLIIYPLTDLGLANDELYSNGMTPGADFAAFVLIALIGLFLLSIKESKSLRS